MGKGVGAGLRWRNEGGAGFAGKVGKSEILQGARQVSLRRDRWGLRVEWKS